MECTQVLQVTKNEFFDQVQNSVLEDIKAATGKKPNIGVLEQGFSYKKQLATKMGKKDTVKIVIEAFHYPTEYSASFHGAQGVNKICYQVESLEDNKIAVHYKEDFEAEGKLKAYNYKLMQFFYKRNSQKRVKRLLDAIENYIITNR